MPLSPAAHSVHNDLWSHRVCSFSQLLVFSSPHHYHQHSLFRKPTPQRQTIVTPPPFPSTHKPALRHLVSVSFSHSVLFLRVFRLCLSVPGVANTSSKPTSPPLEELPQSSTLTPQVQSRCLVAQPATGRSCDRVVWSSCKGHKYLAVFSRSLTRLLSPRAPWSFSSSTLLGRLAKQIQFCVHVTFLTFPLQPSHPHPPASICPK